jgi:uncharacterized membrane protein YqaE (UPF0057 family)
LGDKKIKALVISELGYIPAIVHGIWVIAKE